MADTYYARFFDTSGAAITGGNGQTWLAIPNPNIDVSSVVSPSYSGASASQNITVGPDPITRKLFDAVIAKANVREVEIAHYHDGHLMDAYEFTRVNPTGLSLDFDSGANQLSFLYGGIRAAHYNANGTTSSIQTHDLFGDLIPLQGRDGTLPVATVTPTTAEPITSNSPVAAQDTYVRFSNPSTGAYLIAADGTTYFHVIATEPLAYQNNVGTSSTTAVTVSELNFTIDPASLTAAQQGNFIPAAYSTVIVAAYSIPSDGSARHFVEGGQFSHASIDNGGSDPSSGQYAFTFVSSSLGVLGSSSGPASDGSVNGFSAASWNLVRNPDANVPCYCTGTLILTSRGEVAVEALSVGDLVVTASGEHRPIKWIGYRHVTCVGHPRPNAVLPVLIRAGALEDNVPTRDLYVSPHHAMFLDGGLVEAQLLVNGLTIVRANLARTTYWHIELESHDILLAEAASAESYCECDNRGMFENADVPVALHPKEERPWNEADYGFCAPLVFEGEKLDAIRARLAARTSLANVAVAA